MNKIRLSLVTILLLLFLMINTMEQVSAQASVATVSTSVNGFVTLTGNLSGTVQVESNTQLLQINTMTGAVSVLLDETMPFSSPQISRSGDRVAFYQPQQGLSTYTFATSTKNTVIPPDFAVTRPQSWYIGDTDLLNIDFRFDSNSQTFTYDLQQFNLASSSTSVVLSQVQEQPLTAVGLPSGISQLNLSSIRQATWNPIYPDWLLLQFEGSHPTLLTADGLDQSINVTVLYNKQTGQSISLNDLISDEIDSGQLVWSSTGTEIVLKADDNLDSKTYIIAVNGLDSSPSLQVVSSAVNDHVLLDWFGTSDLLFTTAPDNQTGDSVYYISQIIDSYWFTQEFIRLLDTDFDRVGESDWFNMTSGAEQYQLSCIFDQALQARIGIGERARVNFTDGTPLRLRTEPDFDAPEVTQMAEGTEFDVIGGSACVNGSDYYRFWQLELDDGTTGWAAEANTTDYFIELVPTLGGGGPNQILFSSVTNPFTAATNIFVINPDGTGQTQLTTGNGIRNFPAWSPDGTQILYSSNQDGDDEIFVMNADGSNPVQLTTNTALDRFPVWSPDGTQIAFASRRDGNWEIYVMNADGTNPVNLTNNASDDFNVSWSPDGSQIAFASLRDATISTDTEIYVMNADGTNVQRLTNSPSIDETPNWSPDGSQIAFTSNRNASNIDIYVMNADGTNVQRLTSYSGTDEFPNWSPDGTQIAFDSNRSSFFNLYFDIHRMNADGTNVQRITTRDAFDRFAAWGYP